MFAHPHVKRVLRTHTNLSQANPLSLLSCFNFSTSSALSQEPESYSIKKKYEKQLAKSGYKIPTPDRELVEYKEKKKKRQTGLTVRTKNDKVTVTNQTKSVQKVFDQSELEKIGNTLTTKRILREIVPFPNDPVKRQLYLEGKIIPKDVRDEIVLKRTPQGSFDFGLKGDQDLTKLAAEVMQPVEVTMDQKAEYISTLEIDPDTFFARRPKTIMTYNRLISNQSMRKQPEMAEQTLLAMIQAGIQPDIYTYTGVISAFARKGDYKKCTDYLVKMEEKGLRADSHVYSAIVHGLVKAGQYQKAFDVVESMRAHGVTPSNENMSCLIMACIKMRDFVKMWDTYEQMMSIDLQRPDEVTMGILMYGCAKSGEGERAYSLFNDFDQFNIRPTEVTYNNLMLALAQRPETREKCIDIAKQMHAQGFKLNQHNCNTLLLALAKDGKVERVHEVLEKMKEWKVKPSDHTYATTFQAYANQQRMFPDRSEQNIANALAVYDQLLQTDVPVTEYVLTNMLKVLAYGQKEDLALEFLAKEFPNNNIQPSEWTYTALIKMYYMKQDSGKALALFQKFDKLGLKPPYVAYRDLIYLLLEKGMHNDAKNWLRKMFKVHGYMLRPGDVKVFREIVQRTAYLHKDHEAVAYMSKPEKYYKHQQQISRIARNHLEKKARITKIKRRQ